MQVRDDIQYGTNTHGSRLVRFEVLHKRPIGARLEQRQGKEAKESRAWRTHPRVLKYFRRTADTKQSHRRPKRSKPNHFGQSKSEKKCVDSPPNYPSER